MKKLALLLLLSGCISSYNPEIQGDKPESFDKDLADCKSEAQARHKRAAQEYQSSGRFLLPGLFGAAGAVIDSSTSDAEKDYNKSFYTMADECLIAKGYKIK